MDSTKMGPGCEEECRMYMEKQNATMPAEEHRRARRLSASGRFLMSEDKAPELGCPCMKNKKKCHKHIVEKMMMMEHSSTEASDSGGETRKRKRQRRMQAVYHYRVNTRRLDKLRRLDEGFVEPLRRLGDELDDPIDAALAD